MEIYKELNTPQAKEFQQLLNNQPSKVQIEEGKIVEGIVSKITEKFVMLFLENVKSEAVLDKKELQSLGLSEKIKLNETIPVLIESLENKSGEVVVSASKAIRIQGWHTLVTSYEKNEPVLGKITGRVKGGAIVEHIDTKTLMFLPGSQISSSPLKSIDHLINEVQKFAIIKLDRVRGNICCSRREIIDAGKKQDKAEIIKKYPIGTIIKKAKVKNLSSFGCFFSVNDELDVLVHTSELSWSRVTHPDELFSINQTVDLKVISVDEQKLQVGCSVKRLSADPFENIKKYELNKNYPVKIVKIMDFGAFAELEPGLVTLLHQSELSWSKKNVTAKKILKVGMEIEVQIQEIDLEKRRIAVSYRLTQENPIKTFESKYPVGKIFEAIIVDKNEYSLFVKAEDIDFHCFLHVNDISYLNNGEEELSKYKINDKISVKVLEIKVSEQKIRVGHKQTKKDPFDWFLDKKELQTITVKVISTSNKGLIVRPENCEMDFQIKKSQIAIDPADARPSRWTGGEKIDCAIAELDLTKKKVLLSMKLLEEQERATALEKYGAESSGRNLPFKSLSEDLKKRDKEEE